LRLGILLAVRNVTGRAFPKELKHYLFTGYLWKSSTEKLSMRLRAAAIALGAMLPMLATAHAADGLSERQQLIRQVLRQDAGSPAPLPPLKCGKNDYTTNESGKRIVVTDADGLKSALKGANAGDVIVLGAGDYGWIELNDLHFSDYVRVEGTDGARIKHLGLTNVTHLQIEGVNFEYGSAEGENWKPKIF
jgi:hypothetical protein